MCDFLRVIAWFCDEKFSLKKSCFYLYIRRQYECNRTSSGFVESRYSDTLVQKKDAEGRLLEEHYLDEDGEPTDCWGYFGIAYEHREKEDVLRESCFVGIYDFYFL